MDLTKTPEPQQREFLPENFKITVWSKLRPYYNELSRRPINSTTDLERWILDRTELRDVSKEDFQLRQVHATEASAGENVKALFEYATQELMPRINSMENELNKKLSNCPFKKNLKAPQISTQIEILQKDLEIS